jgi:hypothetical protein
MVKISHETPGDGTDFGYRREEPGKRQCARQHEVGEPPVRVDLDSLTQALDPATTRPR